jgi:hypothetical protein
MWKLQSTCVLNDFNQPYTCLDGITNLKGVIASTLFNEMLSHLSAVDMAETRKPRSCGSTEQEQ